MKKNPSTLVSRIFLSWNGPFPEEGEAQYKFILRWAFYSLKWVVEILAIWGGVIWIVDGDIYNGEPLYITMIIGFALPLGFMVAFIGCIGFLVKAAWYVVCKKKLKFCQKAGDFVENA